MELTITKTNTPKAKPKEDALGFGKYYTDHMFVMDYTDEKGWHDAKITPYAPLELDPAAMVLHYGQATFEGLKAYRTAQEDIHLFRIEKNLERLNRSNERMCMPTFDTEFVKDAILKLVDLDRDWVPSVPGTSLYIRPFVIAVDADVSVHPAHEYKLLVIMTPVTGYYGSELSTVNIYVENEYVRAVKGGTGFAKTAGNYAASLRSQKEAEAKGFGQVLWLDGVERRYVEEVGTMNVFFVIGDEVVTPAINGSILQGITRMSTIEMLKKEGYTVVERRIAIDELYEAHQKGLLKEVFGTGTAAVISPVGGLEWNGNFMEINGNEIGPVAKLVHSQVTGIQYGRVADTFGWITKI